jgi:HD-GYP domain-containing protein (c-di-GMP phosphodiesterase class II)
VELESWERKPQQLKDDVSWVNSAVRALVRVLEAKDCYAREHSRAVAKLVVEIAAYLGLPKEVQEGMKAAARLMDLGKIAISDVILLKPGPLTEMEREIVQCHPLVSAQILEALEFPWPVKPSVRFHHEHWDGSGYPEGLIGEEIPLGARILAVADVFCAMTSERPWRPAHSREEALRKLAENASILYDKEVVKALLAILPPT